VRLKVLDDPPLAAILCLALLSNPVLLGEVICSDSTGIKGSQEQLRCMLRAFFA